MTLESLEKVGPSFFHHLLWPYRPATRQTQEKISLEPVSGALTHSGPYNQISGFSTHHPFVDLMPQCFLLGHLQCAVWSEKHVFGFRVSSCSGCSLAPQVPSELCPKWLPNKTNLDMRTQEWNQVPNILL